MPITSSAAKEALKSSLSGLVKLYGIRPLMIDHMAHFKRQGMPLSERSKAEFKVLKLFSYEHKHKSGEFRRDFIDAVRFLFEGKFA